MVDNFELLRNREIITIFDGDKVFGSYYSTQVSMPYMRNADICNTLIMFGYEQKYIMGCQSLSRWNVFDILLEHCIKTNNISKLLNYLFSKERFQRQFVDLPLDEVDNCYQSICETVISNINSILYFSDKELVKINNEFCIKGLKEDLNLNTHIIETIDRNYIKSLHERASKDIGERNYDSAITKCRTLIEEVFCYAIEEAGEKPSDSGDIQKLYNQVKDFYHMHNNKDMDKRINNLLSGLNKIVSSIAEMRNENSDSHGVGSKRINIEEHHARLILNSASTIAEFFLSVVSRKLTQAIEV